MEAAEGATSALPAGWEISRLIFRTATRKELRIAQATKGSVTRKHWTFPTAPYQAGAVQDETRHSQAEVHNREESRVHYGSTAA